jgi:phosphate/sulfate permease
MNWVTQSFQEHTVTWLVISSVVGGIIATAIRFLFEDIFRPAIGWRREAKQIVHRYTVPLVRSADNLERRINILIRNEKKRWFENDEYFRISTLYQFGELLGWIRIVEREVGFLPFESDKRCREFNRRINGVFRALCSHAYFHRRWFPDVDAVDASIIPRLMLSAIGEAMTEAKDRKAVIEFTEFVTTYANNERFRRWFLELETFLRNVHPTDSLRWDRLIAAGTNLRALVWFLDPHNKMVGRRSAENQDLLVHDEVRAELAKEIPQILTSGRQKSTRANPHKKIIAIYTILKARCVALTVNRRLKT